MKGITVTLYEKRFAGFDGLHQPFYEEDPVAVDNVLVAPVSSTEVLDTNNLTGSKAVYEMAIPKGDTHEWRAGTKVRFFDEYWRIIDIPTKGIETMIPLSWNTKVRVERYEQG